MPYTYSIFLTLTTICDIKQYPNLNIHICEDCMYVRDLEFAYLWEGEQKNTIFKLIQFKKKEKFFSCILSF